MSMKDIEEIIGVLNLAGTVKNHLRSNLITHHRS